MFTFSVNMKMVKYKQTVPSKLEEGLQHFCFKGFEWFDILCLVSISVAHVSFQAFRIMINLVTYVVIPSIPLGHRKRLPIISSTYFQLNIDNRIPKKNV